MGLPSVQAIADHWDSDVVCFACEDGRRLERAHVVPQAISGSDELANLALLCPACHAAAPDTADAAYFWAWVHEHPPTGSEVSRAVQAAEEVLAAISAAHRAVLPHLQRDRLSAAIPVAIERVQPIAHWGHGVATSSWARLLREAIEIADLERH